MMDKLPKQAAHDEKNARRGYSLLLSGFCGLWCGLEGRLPQEAARIVSLVVTVVSISIVVHGISSTPLMEWYRRRNRGKAPLETQ